MNSSSKDKEEPTMFRSSCLTVARSSIKSRSSNCLMDPAITPWLPGLHLTTPQTTNEWTNFKFDSPRPSREDGSSQSNSNFGASEPWPSEKVSSDKQRLRGSRKKKRGGKKQRDKNLSVIEKGKEDDQLSPLGRKVIVFVAVFLFLLCILLVGVTLRLGPVIDEMGKILILVLRYSCRDILVLLI
ncbi:hypothetical protein AVEN_202048-1 [Araneus ventricosus]|uniref:Uncharacterized protein n=1 Tax=Araneus ventricosus TaxID=182803 RepID=A0A4Y2SP29_ARAVE|nr:hypothetical protein AVEN_202048-1 [Araneus ventricosus]